jgi:hypothetical protein
MELTAYSLLSILPFAFAYLRFGNGDPHVLQWALTLNALLIAVLSAVGAIYGRCERPANDGNTAGVMKFGGVMFQQALQFLPLVVALWLGWHRGMPPGMLPSVAAIPILTIAVFFSLFPRGGVGARADALHVLPPGMVAYAVCVFVLYMIASRSTNVVNKSIT